MAEETKDLEQTKDVQMYIDEIKKMKETYVPKELLEKSQENERNLLRTLVEGETLPSSTKEPETRTTEEILTDFNKDTTNLEHIKAVLELHNKRLEQGINDFVPQGYQISPSDEDIRDAKQVEDFLEELVKNADGNPDVFNMEYQKRVIDTAIPKRK